MHVKSRQHESPRIFIRPAPIIIRNISHLFPKKDKKNGVGEN